MNHNRLKDVTAEGVAVGMLIQEFGTRGIAQLLDYAGVDFVTIDMEHSSFGMERVADLLAWLRSNLGPASRGPVENKNGDATTRRQ